MQIDRRTAIKNFLIITAAVSFMPSCREDKKTSSIPLSNFTVDSEQESLLAELAETIIPATDTPGAKAIGAHLFALKMLDDCYSKDDQQHFMRGLEAFDKLSKKKVDQPFVKADPAQRATLLQLVQQKEGVDEDVLFFYGTTKKLTVEAYTTSKYFLTKVHPYELVPSRFHGCVPVKDAV